MSVEAGPAAGTVEPRRSSGRWPAVLAWALWGVAIASVGVVVWSDHLLRQAGRADLVQLTASAMPYLLATFSAMTAGAVLASRQPRHPVGWLLIALGLTVVASGLADGYARYGALVRPGSLPLATHVAVYATESFLPWPVLLGFVLLLTPTGSLPTGRGWRWWAWYAALGPLIFLLGAVLGRQELDVPYQSLDNPFKVDGFSGAGTTLVFPLGALPTALAVPVGAVAMALRFRRARGAERQRLRWVAVGAGLAVLPVATTIIGAEAGNTAARDWSTSVFVALIPLAIVAAILRYRLYDLDRIVSRTLAYGLLTVLLGGAYAAVVLGLGQLAGRQSNLLVAGATLAVAAAFQPARRRIQALVDRRFNRRRYDAARTIEAFSVRLRQQVDLDALRAELLAVVETTMQPTRASLWLRRDH